MSTNYQQFDETERKMKKNEKVKAMVVAFLVGALLSALTFWGISTAVSGDNVNNNKSYLCPSADIVQPTDAQSGALSNIKTVFFNTTWASTPMTDDQKDTVSEAYDIFDENGDETWSYAEFKTFKSMLNNHSSLFDRMDVDNDTIVSIREFVGHLLNVRGVSKFILQQRFENLVYDLYGWDERNATYKSQIFHEYVADIYYQKFDSYGKGYFNLTDFQDMFYNNSFRRFDETGDNMVSFEEFVEGLYHQSTINNPSTGFVLFRNTMSGQQTYKGKDGSTQKAQLYLIRKYDHNDIAAINLSHICPLTEYSGDTGINYAEIEDVQGRRRRLSCVSSSLGCAGSGVEAGADCAEAVAQDGLDPVSDVECGGSAVEAGSDCYDAYDSCTSDDTASSGSTGSYSDYTDYGSDYYSGGYSYGGYY